MDLAIVGRHALLFDDDATAAFINTSDALVPCIADDSLLIDRHDVRHLLDRIPPRHRFLHQNQPELDAERFFDLPKEHELSASLTDGVKQQEGVYQAVPFSYYNAGNVSEEQKDSNSGMNPSCFHPPFQIPERLKSNLPPTEKLHQIIARTAMFVSDHGGQSEIVLRVKQGDNPTFGFLMPDHHLHAYYRYLVDNSHLIRANGDTAKEQEKDKPDYQSRFASGEALSLLGSVYGEDDDDSHQANCEDLASDTSTAIDKPATPNDVAKDASVSKDEGSKFPSSSNISKEKLATIKRNLSVSSAISSAARSNKTKDASNSLPGVLQKPGSSHPSQVGLKAAVLEPPSFLKKTIDKIVDLIIKHGMDFESVLAEQDKPTGRFPFLVPTNQYHSYYLKVLQEAREVSAESKKTMPVNSCKESTYGLSTSESSKECLYDSQRKEKLKMVIGDSKKSMSDQAPAVRQSGLRADEAAAIVLAATRGTSPANAVAQASAPSPAARQMSAEEAAAIVLTATRGVSPANAPAHQLSICKPSISTGSFSSMRVRDTAIKPTASSDASFPSWSIQSSKKESASMTDDEWIEKAIAKTAALAAASEVDSSEASLTKEQKQKAERLKRAKLFASIIKSGNLVSNLPVAGSLVSSGAGSARSGADSDTVAREREGSPVPFGAVSGESDYEVEYKKKHSSKKHSSRHSHHRRDVDREDDHKHHRKRHRFESDASPSRSRIDEKQRRSHSSLKEKESKRHRHYSSSEDEHRHKRSYRSHSSLKEKESKRHRHYSSSEDEYKHKRSYRSHHSDKELIEDANQKKQLNKHLETRRTEESNGSLEDAKEKNVDVRNSDGATEIPSDLRAKIRAMLLETM